MDRVNTRSIRWYQATMITEPELVLPSPAPSLCAAAHLGRWAQFLVGLLAFGVAIVLMIRSGLGLGPWDAFHVGIHRNTGVSVGTVSVVVGALIVGGTWLSGARPGIGTLGNMVLIGLSIDLFLPYLDPAPDFRWGLAYYLLAIGLSGLGTGLYIGAGLGKGPRDGMMIVLSERSGWPVRRVRMAMEVSVLSAGWLLGAEIGVGTLLFAALIGPAAQWGLSRFAGFGLDATAAAVIPPAEGPRDLASPL